MQQRRFKGGDSQVTVSGIGAPSGSLLWSIPVMDSILIEPDGETASLFQASVILGPVTDVGIHEHPVFVVLKP